MSTGSLGDRRVYVPGMSSLVGLHVNTGRFRSPASFGNTAMMSEFQTSPTADLGQDFDLILRKCWSEKFGHYFDENDVDMHCQERNEQLQTKNTLKDSKTTEVIDSVPGAELADNTQDSTMDDWTQGTAVPEQDAGQVIEGDMPVNSKCIRYPFWRSTKKRKTFKKQGHQKKWKVVNSNSFELGFDYSRSQLRCCVKETTVEMENELVQFEMECELFLDSASESSSTPKLSNGKEEKVTNVKVSPIKICPQKDVDGLEESEILDIESSVSCKALSVSVLITPDYVGLRYPEHVRRKKKWAVQKASNQVATKYCQDLCNFSYGKKLYFNHRVFKRMPLAINVLYKPEKRSMRNIDQAKGFTRNVRLKEVVNKPSVGEVVARGPARLARARPAPPPPAYALGQHNADRGLETGIVNILINLQHRELTPEDYELLLRLDERVAPKTVPAQVLENLPTDTVSAEKAGEICSVCLNEYVQGEKLKLLPCGHVFHSACIDTWLKNSSMKCPLDGTAIL